MSEYNMDNNMQFAINVSIDIIQYMYNYLVTMDIIQAQVINDVLNVNFNDMELAL